jgi:hypothetical protein
MRWIIFIGVTVQKQVKIYCFSLQKLFRVSAQILITTQKLLSKYHERKLNFYDKRNNDYRSMHFRPFWWMSEALEQKSIIYTAAVAK